MVTSECMSVKLRTDSAGSVSLRTLLISPSRAQSPTGSEFSEPHFKYAGISVNDGKHSTYMSVFEAEVDLLDKNGEVHRTVRLYPRPIAPKK
ncbi:MAG: hypothetical protein IPQ00_14935 [Chloracidobacterium sp.]|nr:hypothetical protein [Chloracidobacterium sp.]